MTDDALPTWLDIAIEVQSEQLEPVLDQLALLGYGQNWVDQPLTHSKGPDGWVPSPADADRLVIHVYVEADQAAAAESLRQAIGERALAVTVSQQATEEWLDGWRQGRDLVELTDGWCIGPPWLLADAPQPAKVVIIDPGLAFGAGDHVTTQDCGRLVVELAQPGDRVLDLGAGSGVLSILALKLGAESALAVEIDRFAAAEVERNGALNGVQGLTSLLADVTQTDLGGPYELILANLGAGELRGLGPRCRQLVTAGGRAVLSGLVEWAVDSVEQAWLSAGWRRLERRQSDEWVTLALVADAT